MKKETYNQRFEPGWSLTTGSGETVLNVDLSEIKKLSPEEIGAKAKDLITKSEIIQIKFDAHRLTLKYKDAKPRSALKGLEECKELFERLNTSEGREGLMKSQEITFLKSVVQMLRQKAISQTSKGREKAAREYVGRRYSTTFLEVAKNQGFKCNFCGASSDLLLYPTKEADQTNVETRGQVENLQIVCGTCIWDKGLIYIQGEQKVKGASN